MNKILKKYKRAINKLKEFAKKYDSKIKRDYAKLTAITDISESQKNVLRRLLKGHYLYYSQELKKYYFTDGKNVDIRNIRKLNQLGYIHFEKTKKDLLVKIDKNIYIRGNGLAINDSGKKNVIYRDCVKGKSFYKIKGVKGRFYYEKNNEKSRTGAYQKALEKCRDIIQNRGD